MSIEEAVLNGDFDTVVDRVDSFDQAEAGALFLYAVTFEKEEMAITLLRSAKERLAEKVLSEAFISAAAHNEPALIKAVLEQCPEKISKDALLDALRMATAKSYGKVIDALAADNRLADIVNTEDADHPHVAMLAVDQGDSYCLEKLLQLSGIKIEYHHLVYAERRRQFRLAELLKLFMTKEHARGAHEEKEYERAVTHLDFNDDLCLIGPHIQAELQRRKRLMDRGRST